MNFRSLLLGTLAYLGVTFPIAVLWHIVVFKSQYEAIGYIGREEPGFVFGFFAILIQGFLLSLFYPRFFTGNFTLKTGLTFAFWAGLFHWTIHVLAYAAKGDLQEVPLFFAMETVYLTVQFGLFGVLISWIYRKFS